MKKNMYSTKLANCMHAEFTSKQKFNLTDDMAGLLASGIDKGTLKTPQARMIASLMTDWEDAALMDASDALHELHETNSNKIEGFNSYDDNVLINSMKAMAAEAEGVSPDFSKPLPANGYRSLEDNFLIRDMHKRAAETAEF